MVADQAAFPAPPTAPSCDIATGRMFPRLKAIWDDDSYLTADGYYILTEVEDRFAPAPAGPPRPRTPSRKRVVAATRLNIDVDVLEKFGDLTSAAGERNARKASGAGRPFSEKEIRWVKAAAKAIVQRCLE